MAQLTLSQLERFENKLLIGCGPSNDCWDWTAYLSAKGYGRFYLHGTGKNIVQPCAHRVAYEHFVGEIPAGLHLDHTCSRPQCVNPSHLEPVTLEENNCRSGERVTHCRHGHPRDGLKATGKRYCKTCARLYTRSYRAARLR